MTSTFLQDCLKNKQRALPGMAHWIECKPVNPKVLGSIPCQGTCLGCGPGPRLGARGSQLRFLSHIDVPLPVSLSLPHSLKINKYNLKKKSPTSSLLTVSSFPTISFNFTGLYFSTLFVRKCIKMLTQPFSCYRKESSKGSNPESFVRWYTFNKNTPNGCRF